MYGCCAKVPGRKRDHWPPLRSAHQSMQRVCAEPQPACRSLFACDIKKEARPLAPTHQSVQRVCVEPKPTCRSHHNVQVLHESARKEARPLAPTMLCASISATSLRPCAGPQPTCGSLFACKKRCHEGSATTGPHHYALRINQCNEFARSRRPHAEAYLRATS